MQLLHLTDNLYKSLDEGKQFSAIYLDVSKYFDKIWHKGLLNKCQHEFGLSLSLLNWLCSYLKDREQKVKVGQSFSSTKKLNAGCPQGSVLGPLLALIYLNGLADKTTNDILFFADDTSLYASYQHHDTIPTQQSLQRDLDSIFNYGQDWLITFNAEKTILQTFSTRQNVDPPRLTFGGKSIQTNDTHKHLGLVFSKDLNFHEHINEIIRKINRTLSPIYPIASHLPRDTLAQIYTTYVQPHFDYCDTVYDGHLTISDIHRLQTLQNRAARLVTGALFRTSTDRLLLDVGWNSLTVRRKIHRLIVYFKLRIRHQNIPNYTVSALPNTRSTDTGRTLRNSQDQSLPHARTSVYQRSFFPNTTKSWNQLPNSLRQITSTTTFKRELSQQLSVPKPPAFYSLGNKFGNTLHT